VQVLRAQNKYPDSIIVHLSDIYSLNDNLGDGSFNATLHKSLGLRGMLNPILISTEEGFKANTHPFDRRPQPEHVEQMYRCMIGNNRYKYAVDNGYTHIECLVIDDLVTLKNMSRKTFLEPRKMLR
jgi:hypothetical protein